MKDLLRLLQLYKPYAGWMFAGFLLSIVTLLSNVGLMALSGWFIAAMGVAGIQGSSINYFTPAAGIRGLAIMRTGGRYAERLLSHEATLRLLAALRVWFYSRLEPLAPAALQAYRSGDLLSRISSDIDTLDNFYLRILSPVLVALLALILFTLFLLMQDVQLTFTILIFLLLAAFMLPLLINTLAAKTGQRLIEQRAAVRTHTIDGIQGMGLLQIYGAAENHAEKLCQISEQWQQDQHRMGQLTGLSQAMLGLLTNLALWFGLLITIPLVNNGLLPGPNLAMIALFTLAAFEAVMPVPMAFQLLGETLAAARRLFNIIDQPASVIGGTGGLRDAPALGLEWQRVAFSYPGGKSVLHDFSLQVAAGERVIISGPSGAGKSTLFNLLLRFWDPDAGQVLIDGMDLRSLDPEQLRARLAVVSQHSHLFNTTIRENLLLAAPEASQQQLEQACRTAELHDFIMSQPDGYDTWVGEAGVRLSGGQARRLAIARALLKNAPVLLLDEPTEGLDPTTEQQIINSLNKLMAGRTVLIITHKKLSQIQADHIYVMSEGRLQPPHGA